MFLVFFFSFFEPFPELNILVACVLTKLFQFHLIWPNKWLMEKGSFCKHDGTPPFILAIICCMQTDTHPNAKNKRNAMFIHILAACNFRTVNLKNIKSRPEDAQVKLVKLLREMYLLSLINLYKKLWTNMEMKYSSTEVVTIYKLKDCVLVGFAAGEINEGH